MNLPNMKDEQALFTVTAANAAPGGESALYLGSVNVLTLTLSGVDGVTAPAGASINLAFDGNVPETAAKPAVASADGANSVQSDQGHVVSWTLTPVHDGSALPHRFVIRLAGITLSDQLPGKTTELTVAWTGLVGIKPGQRILNLPILASPKPELLDLNDHVNFAWFGQQQGDTADILITPAGEPDVENGFSLVILNRSASDPLVPDGGNSGTFTISFLTVPSDDSPGGIDAICTSRQLADTSANVRADSSGWNVPLHPTGNSWTLTPDDGHVLAGGGSVVFDFSGLVTSLPSFATGLYITWNGISGYNDGSYALPMEKMPVPPQMLTFTSDPSDASEIWAGSPVTLSWTSQGYYGADPVAIYQRQPDGSEIIIHRGAINDSFTVTPSEPTDYRAELQSPALPSLHVSVPMTMVSGTLTASPPGPYASGARITLTAIVTGASSFTVDPGLAPASTPTAMTTTWTTVVTMDSSLGQNPPVTFTLNASGYGPPVAAPVTLTNNGTRYFAVWGDPLPYWTTISSGAGDAYYLVFQSDGNLCLYQGPIGVSHGPLIWDTAAAGLGATTLVFAPDGSLSLFMDPNFLFFPIWTTGPTQGGLLRVTPDGRAGIYAGTLQNPGPAIWSVP